MDCHQDQVGVHYLAQGHDMQIRVRDRTTNLLISRQPIQSPEPQSPTIYEQV